MNEGRARPQSGERALHQLARVEPPAGMQGRVLRRLQDVAVSRPVPRGWARSWRLSGLLVATLAMLVVLSLWMARGRHPAAGATAFVAVPRPSTIVASTQDSHGLQAPVRFKRLQRSPPGHTAKHVRPLPVPSAPPSYPAPPAPLTHEEQLLLRLAVNHAAVDAPAYEALVRVETVRVPGTPLPTFSNAMNTGDQP